MDIPTWLMTTVTPLGALIGFIVAVGWSILKGSLMPDSTYERLKALHDAEVANLTKALEVSQAQVTALTETAQTTNALLASLARTLDLPEEVS